MRDQTQQATKAGVVLVLVMGGLYGCSSMPSEQDVTGGTRRGVAIGSVPGVPDWVTKGGAAFSGDRAVFYGVGNAAGLQNPALRRRSAEAAARRALSQTFQVYVAGLNKQFLAETTARDMEASSVEQHVEDVSKQVTSRTLMGSKVVDYWEHPNRNEAYALVRMDLEQFLKDMQSYGSAAGQFKELDKEMREFVRKNAEKAHEELSKELEKQSEQ